MMICAYALHSGFSPDPMTLWETDPVSVGDLFRIAHGDVQVVRADLVEKWREDGAPLRDLCVEEYDPTFTQLRQRYFTTHAAVDAANARRHEELFQQELEELLEDRRRGSTRGIEDFPRTWQERLHDERKSHGELAATVGRFFPETGYPRWWAKPPAVAS